MQPRDVRFVQDLAGDRFAACGETVEDRSRVLREVLVDSQVPEQLSAVDGQVELGCTPAVAHRVELGEDLVVFADDAGAARSDALEESGAGEPGVETEESAVGIAEETVTACG